jgi:F-type H+-transporting ATPase subunit gamma
MPSLKDIRSKIESTKNTQQITRAMKMVSAAKLRRAQQNIVNLRPYANGILSVIADIASTHRLEHPLLSITIEPKKVLVVVLTSDRGLCGGFNTNACKAAEKFYRANKPNLEKLDFIFIGRRAQDYFKRRNISAVDSILSLEKVISYTLAANLSSKLLELYRHGEYDEIRMVYNEFKSAIAQNVVVEKLLPVDVSQASTLVKEGVEFSKDMIFEPAPEIIIDQLLEKHFAIQVYRCMSESVASEHGARMTSMENATKNAGEMIRSYTLTYNKLRQASITTELIEITSGAEALKA